MTKMDGGGGGSSVLRKEPSHVIRAVGRHLSPCTSKLDWQELLHSRRLGRRGCQIRSRLAGVDSFVFCKKVRFVELAHFFNSQMHLRLL